MSERSIRSPKSPPGRKPPRSNSLSRLEGEPDVEIMSASQLEESLLGGDEKSILQKMNLGRSSDLQAQLQSLSGSQSERQTVVDRGTVTTSAIGKKCLVKWFDNKLVSATVVGIVDGNYEVTTEDGKTGMYPPAAIKKLFLGNSEPPALPKKKSIVAQGWGGAMPGLNFASLTHCLNDVYRQTEHGGVVLGEVASLLTKIGQLQLEFSRNVMKVFTEADATKVERPDGMKGWSHIWKATQIAVRQYADMQVKQASHLLDKVVSPLQDLQIHYEETRKSLVAEEKGLTAEVQGIKSQLAKDRVTAEKLLEGLRATYEKPSELGANKATILSKIKYGSLGRNQDKQQEKVYQVCKQYEDSLSVANRRQETYLQKELPSVLMRLESLENARLQVLQKGVGKFAEDMVHAHGTAHEAFVRIAEQLHQLHPENDTADYVKDVLMQRGIGIGNLPLEYDLSCTSEDVRAGRLFRKPSSPFACTLQQLMKNQPTTSTLPLIFEKLLENFDQQNGYNAEGIFRISVPQDDLKQIVETIDNGQWPEFSSPHHVAATLKLWLRQLTEPVFPESLYAEVMAFVGLELPDMDETLLWLGSLSVFWKLDEINQRVIVRLAVLVQRVSALREENRMDVGNLAVVFAPSLLRNDKVDPMSVVEDSGKAVRFMYLLFRALIDAIEKQQLPLDKFDFLKKR